MKESSSKLLYISSLHDFCVVTCFCTLTSKTKRIVMLCTNRLLLVFFFPVSLQKGNCSVWSLINTDKTPHILKALLWSWFHADIIRKIALNLAKIHRCYSSLAHIKGIGEWRFCTWNIYIIYTFIEDNPGNKWLRHAFSWCIYVVHHHYCRRHQSPVWMESLCKLLRHALCGSKSDLDGNASTIWRVITTWISNIELQ